MRLLLLYAVLWGVHGGFWRHSDRRRHDSRSSQRGRGAWVRPLRAEYAELDFDAIRVALDSETDDQGNQITLPFPDGSEHRFYTNTYDVMHPDLAQSLPDTYVFRLSGVTEPWLHGAGDYTPLGFHAQIFTPQGTVYIDPYTRDNRELYTSYFVRDLPSQPKNCKSQQHSAFHPMAYDPEREALAKKLELYGGRGSSMRIRYRLAVVTTREYTAALGGHANALNQVISTFTRVAQLWERELGITLQLVAGQASLIFNATSAYVTDYPLSNTDGYNNIRAAASKNIEARLGGPDTYDVGHTLTTGQSGGIAYVGVICYPMYKAGGSSGVPNPTGDGFAVGIVAHEMGHQAGADHTFAGYNAVSPPAVFTGYCQASQYGVAVEPGSGSTIMSYAGLCGSANDYQGDSEDYYHSYTLRQMTTYVMTGVGSACGQRDLNSRQVPTVTVEAGGSIPQNTPFVLQCRASTSSIPADVFYYNWEQVDVSASQVTLSTQTTTSPLFRSVKPSATGNVRFFPALANVISNTNRREEALPTMARTITMRCTARDRSGYSAFNTATSFGLYGDADQVLQVVSNTQAFAVTFANTAGVVVNTATFTVTWTVASTASSPINAATVDIFLSTDSGVSWYGTTPALAGVPNTGSAVVPNTFATTQTRVRVVVQARHVAHFYDMSNADFTINPPPAPLCAQNSDCASPPVCKLAVGATCSAGTCSYPNAPLDANCVSNNNAGYCAANAVCVTCPQTCTTPPACRTTTGASCSAGRCVYPQLAAVGAGCNDGSGTGACDSAGACVRCSAIVCATPGVCEVLPGVCSVSAGPGVGYCTYNAAPGALCSKNSLMGTCTGTKTCVTCADVTCTPGPCQEFTSCTNGVCAYSTKAFDAPCVNGTGVAGYCSGLTCVTQCGSCNLPPACRTQGVCVAGRCAYNTLAAVGADCVNGGIPGDCDANGSCLTCQPTTCNAGGLCEVNPGVCSVRAGAAVGFNCVYSAVSAGTGCTKNAQAGRCNATKFCVTCADVACAPGPCQTSLGCTEGQCSYQTKAQNADCQIGAALGWCDGLTCVTTCAAGCNSPPTCRAAGSCVNGRCVYNALVAAGTDCVNGATPGDCDASGTCLTCQPTTCNAGGLCEVNPGVCAVRAGAAVGLSCTYAAVSAGTACTKNAQAGRCNATKFCVTCADVTCASGPCQDSLGCTEGQCAYQTKAPGATCQVGAASGWCDGLTCVTTCAAGCNQPPACRATGACVNGRCVYNTLAAVGGDCMDGSTLGDCDASGTCQTCQPSTCSAGGVCEVNPGVCTVRAGSAVGFTCAYAAASVGTGCTKNAQAGRCNATKFCQTCADVSCTPGACQSFVSCTEGQCAFQAKAQGADCQVGSAGGWCDGLTCVTACAAGCNQPPTCYSAGTCVNGRCQYTQRVAVGSGCVGGGSGTESGVCDAASTCVVCSAVTCASSGRACEANPGVCSLGAGSANGYCAYAATAGAACVSPLNALVGVCNSTKYCVTCPDFRCSPGPCQDASCQDGVCAYTSKAAQAACVTLTGAVGKCSGLTCVPDCTTATQCNSPPTCYTLTNRACTNGGCVYPGFAPTSTSCTSTDGYSGKCNAAGSCVACAGTTAPSCASSANACHQLPGTCTLPTTDGGSFCAFAFMATGASCAGANGLTGRCSAANACVTCAQLTCDAPPACRTATGATCVDGVCSYPTPTGDQTCTTATGAAGRCSDGVCKTCADVTCPNTACLQSSCSVATAGFCSMQSNCPAANAPLCKTGTGTCSEGGCAYTTNAAATVSCAAAVGEAAFCGAGVCVTCRDVCAASTVPVCRVSSDMCSSSNQCTYTNAALNTECSTTAIASGRCNTLGTCANCVCPSQLCKVAASCVLTASNSASCTMAAAPNGTPCSKVNVPIGQCQASHPDLCCKALAVSCTDNRQCCSQKCRAIAPRICLA